MKWVNSGTTTLSAMTFSITTLSIRSFYVTLSLSDSQQTTLGITIPCYYAECHYADSRILFAIMLNVVMLSAIMLSVVMLSVAAPTILSLLPWQPWVTRHKQGYFYLCHVRLSW